MVRGNGGLCSPHSGGQQEAADGTSQCYGAGAQVTDAIARHGTRAGSRGKRHQECDAGGCADLGSGVEYPEATPRWAGLAESVPVWVEATDAVPRPAPISPKADSSWATGRPPAGSVINIVIPIAMPVKPANAVRRAPSRPSTRGPVSEPAMTAMFTAGKSSDARPAATPSMSWTYRTERYMAGVVEAVMASAVRFAPATSQRS